MKRETKRKYQAREFDESDTKGANLADPRGGTFWRMPPFSLLSLRPLIRESWLSRSTQTFRELWIAKHHRRNTLREPDADALQSRQRARENGTGAKERRRERETDREKEREREREREREGEETYECGAMCRIMHAASYPSGFSPWLPDAGWRGQNWSKIACERASREITRSVRRGPLIPLARDESVNLITRRVVSAF
jgi:hypothetical protein